MLKRQLEVSNEWMTVQKPALAPRQRRQISSPFTRKGGRGRCIESYAIGNYFLESEFLL